MATKSLVATALTPLSRKRERPGAYAPYSTANT
jgi:hypothetical protein